MHTVVLRYHHYLHYLPLFSLYNFVFSNVIPLVFWVMSGFLQLEPHFTESLRLGGNLTRDVMRSSKLVATTMSPSSARGLSIPELLRVLTEKFEDERVRMRGIPFPPIGSTASLEREVSETYGAIYVD